MEVEGAVERPVGATMEDESNNIDQKPLKKCTVSEAAAAASNNGCFDCNICLDFAADPVVTLCGHLYCWPCIYKWLQQGDGASPQQCPVCKAALLQQSLVPLYGRGQSIKEAPQQIVDVPRRPSFHREAIERRLLQLSEEQDPATQPLHFAEHQQHHILDHPFVNAGSEFPVTRVLHSTSGEVLGGMAEAVLPWMFRNQEWARVYYSSPYHLTGNGGGSPRVRRQEMQLERSLHQIWVFLFCCAILCLLLF
ncbi:E3 ubiquitin-protein ligase [Canna indica]|uniref:E3 ubiquitin-protein ligase RMA n=1 Tax=Canna indica TaxID=4628 RepID=A0AAQ3KCS2_9LILI|nr:E3 ubiquitin-protein ligase [Canna indica]